MVAVEEREKAGLCAGRALGTAETNVVARTLEVAEIPEKFLCAKSEIPSMAI